MVRWSVAALVGMFALVQTAHAVAPAPALSAAEVQKLIVGHDMTIGGDAEDAVVWHIKPGGKYTAEDRNYHEGRYLVRPDGKLCWNESNGISGCFQYIRKGKAIVVRRADPGHDFELGEIALAPLSN